jgi:8-oxo-dGTP diphosphatase
MKRLNTTSVIVRNTEGKYLGVSRKDNYTSFGFAGGKCEKIKRGVEETPEACAIRELKEETGLTALELKLIDVREYVNQCSRPQTLDTVYCYEVVKYEGKLHTEEYLKEKGEGMLRWVTDYELCAGAFGDYNWKILKLYYNLQTVWLVENHQDYEGGMILGVFTSEEKAIKYANDYVEYYNKQFSTWNKQPHYKQISNLSWRGSSESIDVTEQLVDTEIIDYETA